MVPPRLEPGLCFPHTWQAIQPTACVTVHILRSAGNTRIEPGPAHRCTADLMPDDHPLHGRYRHRPGLTLPANTTNERGDFYLATSKDFDLAARGDFLATDKSSSAS